MVGEEEKEEMVSVLAMLKLKRLMGELCGEVCGLYMCDSAVVVGCGCFCRGAYAGDESGGIKVHASRVF